MKKNNFHSIALTSLVAILLLLPLAAIPGPDLASAHSGPTGSAVVRIDGKTANSIIVSERHFRVTERTSILDPRGLRIPLDALPIPCEAELHYRLRMDEDPLLLKVLIQKIPPGASPVWPRGRGR